MTKRIFRAVFLTAALLSFISFILVLSVQYNYFASVQKNQLRAQLELIAHALEREGPAYLEGLHSDACRVTWVDPEGTVRFDSEIPAAEMENHAERQEIQDALASGTGESERFSTTMTEKTLYLASRLPDGTVLRVSASYRTVLALALGMLPPMCAVLALVIAASALLARRLARRIIDPLNGLDLDHPLENNAYEELSPFLHRIDHQHQQIDRQLDALKRREQEFSAITGSMREGLVLLNAGGTILSINPAALKLFGADASCVGQDFLTVHRAHDVTAAIARARAEGHSELRLEQASRQYQLALSRIDSEDGAQGVALLAFDITERAQAEQLRREFTANVSHELKTPLQSIMGSAELLQGGLVKPEDAPRFIGRIHSEAARLVALIDDIIRLSQLDERRDLPMEPVDLLALVRDAVAPLQPAAEAKRVRIDVEGESAQIKGVPRLLCEIAYNLCDNAIKYNTEGGTVQICVSQQPDGVQLTVKDSGIGIPREHQQRVFERFYRVDKSHSRASGGTGLGLSIVKHAAQLHNARIELHSECGVGTTVTLVFPRA